MCARASASASSTKSAMVSVTYKVACVVVAGSVHVCGIIPLYSSVFHAPTHSELAALWIAFSCFAFGVGLLFWRTGSGDKETDKAHLASLRPALLGLSVAGWIFVSLLFAKGRAHSTWSRVVETSALIALSALAGFSSTATCLDGPQR